MKITGILVLFVLAAALSFASSLLAAQFVVFGLSMMHVNSGIWGPYFILVGISTVVSTSVAVNSKK